MIFKNFRVDIIGDVDMEDLSADIYFKDQFVAMISQERGFENLEIELLLPKNPEFWSFSFTEFDEAIQYAKNCLWELCRLPENHNNVHNTGFDLDDTAILLKDNEDASSINRLAQDLLDDILTHPEGYSLPNKSGGYNYYKPDESGVFFYANGEFRGFIKP